MKGIEPKIGIDDDHRQAVCESLSILLADEFVLYVKTRNAHWNVEGPDFHSAHKFFESQYEFLDEAMDDVAERVRSVGHYAPAALNEFLKLTNLSEQSSKTNGSTYFIKELLADHESIIIRLRECINVFAVDYHDTGSSDFVTGLMEKHEKMSWMLRAHLR